MGAKSLGSRGIIGRFYELLEQDPGTAWVDSISNYFQSDQESEIYRWLGMSPVMREWIGGRVAKGFRENGVQVTNKKFEATLAVPVDWMRRDKTGQIDIRIGELVDRTTAHWNSLLTALLIAGEASACYDGQFFFDTDHAEGDSGTQSNDLTYAGVTTPAAPTAGQMEAAIMAAVVAILGFKDDQGEPMNENARQFTIMAPLNYMQAAAAALRTEIIIDGSTSRSSMIRALGTLGGFSMDLAVNSRLTNTDRFYVFRTDARTKAFIRQEEEGVTVSAVAEGSEREFMEDEHLYGVKALRNVAYGYWQRAAVQRLTT